MAVNRDGILQVFWYDRRGGPDNLKITVWTVRSVDGGRSFSSNLALTSDPVFPAVGYDPILAPTYMGDYVDIKRVTRFDGPGNNFVPAWADFKRLIKTNGGTRRDQDVFFLHMR